MKNGQKHGKVNQKNNMLKIQFIIEVVFDMCIKNGQKSFVSENIKPSQPPLGL